MAIEVRSRAELDAVLGDPTKVLLFVMGDGDGLAEMVENADNAVHFPEIQASVWISNLAILTPEERAEYEPGDPTYVACALSSPPRKVCALVSRKNALTLIFMKAFDAAQQRQYPPRRFDEGPAN